MVEVGLELGGLVVLEGPVQQVLHPAVDHVQGQVSESHRNLKVLHGDDGSGDYDDDDDEEENTGKRS